MLYLYYFVLWLWRTNRQRYSPPEHDEYTSTGKDRQSSNSTVTQPQPELCTVPYPIPAFHPIHPRFPDKQSERSREEADYPKLSANKTRESRKFTHEFVRRTQRDARPLPRPNPTSTRTCKPSSTSATTPSRPSPRRPIPRD